MNARLIYATFWFIFVVWNFHDWRKTKDKDFAWLIAVGVVGLFAEITYFYLIVINIQETTLSIIDSLIKIFDVIGITSFAYILVKNLARKE